jgi:Neprosin
MQMRPIRFRSWRAISLSFFTVVAMVGLPSIASGQTAARPLARTSGFVPFQGFLAQLRSSTYESVIRDGGPVLQSAAELASSKSYLLSLYKGVVVRESFVTDGTYFDCVTVTSQPTVNALGITHIASPPPKPAGIASVAGDSAPWVTTGTDQNGQVVSCPSGTVPMRRTTLQQVASYRTLHDFLSKDGRGATADNDDPGYRHAYGYQAVNNDGGASVLNVWNPKVVASTAGDDHSLSQQWVLGGTGSKLQSAEAGWTKDPDFSTTKPVYFVYFTANDYASIGCYDLECTGFVQTDKSLALGAPVTPCCSTKTGVNDSFSQEWFLSKGDWWLAINGTYIGYYPVAVYKGGQLSRYSTLIEFGGEVNGSVTSLNWPAMGSGAYASSGPGQAAYQSSIEYINRSAKAFWANLTTQVTGAGTTPSPCYSLAYTSASGSTGTFFYYGGPGGKQSKC